MSDYDDDQTALNDADMVALGALLGGETIWAEPDPLVEARVLSAVQDETGPVERLVQLRPGIAERRHLRIIAIAAGVLLTLGVTIGLLAGGDDESVTVALAGTDLAPNASAVAELIETPQGLIVLLDVTGLVPAEPGTYYQGWIRNNDDTAVTIGTFHLRGGDGEIELWGGVTSTEYPIITVTLQQEGDGAQSSGQVVLRGRVEGT